jgi:NTE family protein
MNNTAEFLATCPVFSGMSPEQIDDIAPLFRTANYKAGDIILKQGGYSTAVYFLRSGRLAVRIQRGRERDTVAMLQPPEAFGELSFLTGRQCVADIEVVVDSEIVFLPKEAVPKSGPQSDALNRGLLGALATRLQVTMQRGASAVEKPVVLIRNYPHWQAPEAFAGELAASLTRQTGLSTLLVNVGSKSSSDLVPTGDATATIDVGDRFDAETVRPHVTRLLNESKRYTNVLLNVMGPDAAILAEQIQDLSNFRGFLLGADDPVPEVPEHIPHFIVQSGQKPTLPFLSGSRQLIREEAESETAFRQNQPVTARFRQTVDSIARRIGGIQVGLALGGGAAWGFAHIGVLAALREAGLPIDVIAGCSMGSVIGSLYACGYSVEQLTEVAEYWRNRTGRFLEWRFWRMCLVSERMVRKVFTGYFGDKAVNHTDMPFWANAVDIEGGEEHTIRDGLLVDCIRGSIALPGLLPPYARPPRLLVDAGIMDPVPAEQLRTMGSQYAVAINAMAAPGTTEMSSRYPFNAFNVMIKCMFVMGHSVGQRAEKAADIVFTPDLAGINLLQFKRAPEIIECGRRATEVRVTDIMAGYQRLKDGIRRLEST